MKHFLTTTIMAIAFTIIPATLFAATPVTLEGQFQGANCIFYNKSCPHNMTDGHIATEPDFVFVIGNGKYVFIQNLDRGLKVKYLHADIKLVGKQTGDSVRAETVKVKENGKFKTVWSLRDQEEERRRMDQK